MIWRVFQEEWGPDARLMTLVDRISRRAPTFAARVRFGLALNRAQILQDVSWVLFSHVSLALANRFVFSHARRPYAIFLHGIEVWRPLNAAQEAAVRGAHLLIANSRYTADRVAATHPWVGPIAVCELALPERTSGSTVTPPSITPASVLVVGRMDAGEQYKGHDQLLEAWPSVRASVPGAQLVIAGTGTDVERLRVKAQALGIADAVLFTGFVSDAVLTTLYERASVFAMPSRNEGFGLVYLEAMSHGLPCIGSIHDAASSVVEHGVTGYLVDQADIPTLADHLIRLLSDSSLREALGQAGRRRVADRFTYGAFKSRLLPILERAFSGQTVPSALANSPSLGDPR